MERIDVRSTLGVERTLLSKNYLITIFLPFWM